MHTLSRTLIDKRQCEVDTEQTCLLHKRQQSI